MASVITEVTESVKRSKENIDAFNNDVKHLENYIAGKDKMMLTIAHIRSHYVDPLSIDTIYEKAIPALLSELDPHSEYIPAKLYDKVNENLEARYKGLYIIGDGSGITHSGASDASSSRSMRSTAIRRSGAKDASAPFRRLT